MEPGGLASGTSGRGLRTSRTILTQFFHMFPTFVYSYLTLRNGGIALAQAHIASLIIFVSQCVNLCIVYLTSTKYAKMSCSIIKKRPNCFSEGSSICATTLFATPSAMLRSAGQPRHQDHLHHHQGKPIQGPLLLNHPYPLPLRHLLLHPRMVGRQKTMGFFIFDYPRWEIMDIAATHIFPRYFSIAIIFSPSSSF